MSGGEGPPSAASPAAAWRVLAGDTRGVVVTDGTVTRGFARDSADPVWEVKGEPRGVFCDESCPDAQMVLLDDPTRYRTQGAEVSRVEEPPGVTGELTPLGRDGDAVVVVRERPEGADLLSVTDTEARTLARLGAGVPVWRGDASGGTVFMLGEGRTGAAGLRFDRPRPAVRQVRTTPRGLLCYDAAHQPLAAVPGVVLRAWSSTLSQASECLQTSAGTWVGLTTYVTVAGPDETGVPTIELSAVDGSGSEVWHHVFVGSDRLALSPDGGRTLAAISDQQLQVVDTVSGEVTTDPSVVQDVLYADPGELAYVTPDGDPGWIPAPAASPAD